MALFRPEIEAFRADRLSGDVAVAVPVSWQAIGYLLIGSIGLGGLFLWLAEYSRVETVAGTITPDAGVAQILPVRSGILSALPVRDNQQVGAGQQLASIRAEEDSASGGTASAKVAIAIADQDSSLAAQSVAALVAAKAQKDEVLAQREGLEAEIAQLQSQIALQRDLVSSARRDLDRTRGVAARGFISGRDLQLREETVLARQQQLSQLSQSLASRRSALWQATRSAERLTAQARVQDAALTATRAQVAQQAASTDGTRAYVLRAPIAGRVTALTARVGQSANPQIPLMAIVPTNSVLRAELAVPSSAIGFVKRGQEVRLAIDAFPYQRFGTVKGKVLTVASSAVQIAGPNGSVVPAYPVTVALDKEGITAFDRTEALISGMTLTARIVTEKQSLARWLFEPLYAVRRR